LQIFAAVNQNLLERDRWQSGKIHFLITVRRIEMQTAWNLPAWNRLKAGAIATTFLTMALIHPAMAEEKLLRTLTVTGLGVESIPTTKTQVSLGVEATGKTPGEVQAEVARRSIAVVSLLRSRQVEDLKTTGISLSPIYRYSDGQQTLTGYKAANIVSFRILTQQSGDLLDEAVNAGASRIDELSFISSAATVAAAQKTALQKAALDAQSQADAVLSSLGLTRREVITIQVNGSAQVQPQPLSNAFTTRGASATPSPVIGGEQRVEASVTLQIRY
jgi:uncharacterized protein